MKLRDQYGWPLELIEGKPITNFFRRLILTNLRMTWKWRNSKTEEGPIYPFHALGHTEDCPSIPLRKSTK